MAPRLGLGPVGVGPGDGAAQPRRRVVGVEPEPPLEHLVGGLLGLGERLVLGEVGELVVQPVLDLLLQGALVELGRRRLRRGGRAAAVAAGGHPDAGEAVGGPGVGGLVVGAEELAEGEHSLGEPLGDDAGAGGGKERAERRPGVAGELLELVGVGFEALGDVVPRGPAGPELGDPLEELVVVRERVHGGPREVVGGEVYACPISFRFGKSNRMGGLFRNCGRGSPGHGSGRDPG